MKTVAFIILMFVSVLGIAQAKLGMHTSYMINPVTATSSSVGAIYESTIAITCAIQNKGNAVFNGTVALNRVVISNSVQSTNRVVSTLSVSLNPGDSINVTFADSIKSGVYKQNGNGNTVVVWPVSSGIQTVDSLRTIPVYVSATSSIHELVKNNIFLYPNPASEVLFIKPEKDIEYKSYTVYNMQSKEVMKGSFVEKLDIKTLSEGVYCIIISTGKGVEYKSVFTKTD